MSTAQNHNAGASIPLSLSRPFAEWREQMHPIDANVLRATASMAEPSDSAAVTVVVKQILLRAYEWARVLPVVYASEDPAVILHWHRGAATHLDSYGTLRWHSPYERAQAERAMVYGMNLEAIWLMVEHEVMQKLTADEKRLVWCSKVLAEAAVTRTRGWGMRRNRIGPPGLRQHLHEAIALVETGGIRLVPATQPGLALPLMWVRPHETVLPSLTARQSAISASRALMQHASA